MNQDICLLNEIDEDKIIENLKSRYESNLIYTRINDNSLIILNSNLNKINQLDNNFQLSLDYVNEYKNTNQNNVKLEPHIFQMINHVYLHMRRTGINQSVLLSGNTGSGKSETSNMILSHLISLSNHKKESKLQTQILHIQSILDAFGHAKTLNSTFQNASQFGKYVEFQFNERGRMIGCKILNYLLDKKRVQQKDQSNFHVFYYLLLGASASEKQSLNLTLDSYNYLNSSLYTSEECIEQYEALKASLRHFGLGKRYHTRIIQLLASIMMLGQLVFVDDKDEQEAAFVKNVDVLESLSESLGIDPYQLQSVLTYKTKLIGKDITTLILNAEQASHQRDELATILYSLLFTWLIEHMNSKLCCDDVYNVIGVLDLPGWSLNQQEKAMNLDKFCLNYANERLEHYILNYIFEVHTNDYKVDNLQYPVIDYQSNASCIELIDQSRHGIIDIVNNLSKKSSKKNNEDYSTNLTIIDTFNKYQSGNKHLSFEKSDTGSNVFLIQHFNGTQAYQPDDFIEFNRDALNADFVTLFKGGSDSPPSANNFIVNLFEDKSILTESHPKDVDNILNAQQNNKPNRSPSMKRSKSVKKNGDDAQLEKSKTKKVIPTVLAQLRSSLDDLFNSLDESIPWFVFCIRPNQYSNHYEFDSQFVKSQVQVMQLKAIAQNFKQYPYTNIFTFDDFLERYLPMMKHLIEDDQSSKEKCQLLLNNTLENQRTMMSNENIYLDENAWRILEDKLRELEKQDQKKQRDGLLESRAVLTTTTVVSETVTETPSYNDEFSSHQSFGSNDDLIINKKNKRAMADAAMAAGLPLPKPVFNNAYISEDQRSFMSEDKSQQLETHSQAGSENPGPNPSDYFEMKTIPVVQKAEQEEEQGTTGARKRWLAFVWCLTWWVPTPFLVWCGRMKRSDVQIAWREKLTLCIIIFLMSGTIIWFLVFFGKLICPHQYVYSVSELQAHSTSGNAYVAIRGEVFDLSSFAPHHWASQVITPNSITAYGGKDVSDLFPVQVSALCQGVNGTVSDYVSLDYHFNLTDTNSKYHDFRAWTDDSRPDWYYEKMTYLRKNYKMGNMAYTKKDVHRQAVIPVDMGGIKTTRTWAILNGSVYDLTYYVSSERQVNIPVGVTAPNNTETNYMSDAVVNLFKEKSGQDISKDWNALSLEPDTRYRQEVCLRNLFYVGALDQRDSPQCIFSEYLLLIVTVFLCLVIVFKFLAALQFRAKKDPEDHEKFVICQVPCYTEGEEELKKTIDSIAMLKYDDKRKLLFIVCDGMIVGGGNDRPTPQIVLDILGADPYVDPEPLSFLSVGEGQKQHNMAKVYSGLYECRGHVVPYIVVSKVGKPSERQKPGNRGKRDSQLILMRFLNKIHFNAPMTPMELEIYHQIKNIIGVNPSFYEFILMVDADTEVKEDGLSRLVTAFIDDSKIIGLCGETKLSNEKDTWVTMIQVYEYFISHYMIKAFESLFGSVTCLPGCFCMYRIRSPTKNQPLLISNEVIDDYHINKVDTLHKKNLLHLGEDRYLTTLILKHFPTHKTKFVPDAKCLTNAPDRWSVLLSQRRRWINSTIHNLGELVFLPQLCGFCCFSMRFVVMLDLISTLVQPAIVGYLVFLIYTLATSPTGVPLMSIITIAGVYGLQAIIFILHRKWEHIVWMIVSIIAIPVFSFYIPIYSYWHFDDFSWGNTRVVLGDKGRKKMVGADEGHFDPNTIPTMTWEKYEEGLYTEDWNQNDNASVGSKGSFYSQGSSYSRGSQNVHKQNQYQSPSPQKSYPSSQYSMNQLPPSQLQKSYASSQYSMNMSSNQSFASSPLQNSHVSVMHPSPYGMMNGSVYSRTTNHRYE